MHNRRVSFDEFIDAAGKGNVLIVNRYITENKNNSSALNASDHCGVTAMTRAVVLGQTEVVRILLRAGAAVDIDPASKFSDENALTMAALKYPNLHTAARNGCIEIVCLFVIAGTPLNAVSGDKLGRNTALMEAAEYGQTEVVRILLTAGADFTLKNIEGKTAEMVAENDKIRSMLKEKTTTLAFESAISNVNFLLENGKDNPELLAELINSVSKLAQRSEKLKTENAPAPHTNCSIDAREKDIQARLKTFGPSHYSSSASTINHNQQIEKKDFDDQVSTGFSSLSFGSSK